jgi:cell division protein ZapA
MSAKKSTKVLIDGKVYTLSGYEEEDYLQKIATYLNSKIEDFQAMDGYKNLSVDMKQVLININVADEYFKAKDLVDKLEGDMELRDKEIYDLKHDLISEQVKITGFEEQIEALEKEKKELLQIKARLEASLEEALLGPE